MKDFHVTLLLLLLCGLLIAARIVTESAFLNCSSHLHRFDWEVGTIFMLLYNDLPRAAYFFALDLALLFSDQIPKKGIA